jgi:HD-like signal output (HDOD) protein
MTTRILDKLMLAMQGSKGVPATERSVASVLGALDTGDAGKREIVHHIIEDFALTQKVLKLANSAMYAPFGTGAASVSSAMDVLGSEAVLHLVLGTDLVSEEEVLQDENLSRTLLASELARNACADRAEDASIAALMYEIGRLMTSKYLHAETAAIDHRVAQGMEVQAASVAVLGMTYQELGVELAARWNLPLSIISTMDGTGDPTLVGIARFSSEASSLIHAGKFESVNTLLRNLDLPGIDKSLLGSLVSRKVEEAKPFLLARQSASASAEHALDALLQMLILEKKGSVEELSNAMLPELAARLETAHCLLFMLTRSGDFRVRNAFGKGIDELKSRLRITAEFMPTTFHAAIKNNIDISIADVSKLKEMSLPEGYRQLLPQVTKFIILPIATSRVSGLLYCDWDSDKTLKHAEMEAVKKLRSLFVSVFPQ